MSSHDCIKRNNIFFFFFFFFLSLSLFFISAKSTQLLPSAGIQNAVHRYGAALYISSFPGLSGEGSVPRRIYIEVVARANVWWDRCLGIIPRLWSLPWVRRLLLPRHLKSRRWNPSGKLLIEAGKLARAEKKLQSKIGEETSKTPFLTILAGLRRDEARGEVYHDLLLSAPEAGWAGWGGFRLFSEHNTYLSNCMWGTSRAGSNMQTAPALTPSTLWKTLRRLCELNIIGRIIFALSPLINAFLSVALVRRRIDRTYLFTERLGGRCDRAAGDSTHLRSTVIKDDGQCLYTVRKF